jgi:hypothetical protein
VTHRLRVTKDGKKLLLRPASKPKGLAQEEVEKLFRVPRIKTGNTFRQGTTGKRAKVAQARKRMSLVAGNVTGGGGKATTKKTYRHGVSRETQQNVKTSCVLTGETLAASIFGIQKQVMIRVYI